MSRRSARWCTLSFVLLAAAASAQTRPEPGTIASDYQPITAKGRLKWFAKSSFGPESLAAGLFTAGWGTLRDNPHEYGTHWEGFGDRYGMRFTGVVTGKAIEGGLGSLWGEDPRYFRAAGQPFGTRVKRVVVLTFMAVNRNGDTVPAYARYIAAPANNFLSNTWREPSEANTEHALIRTADGFLARIAGNAFAEFWPDLRRRKHAE